MDTDLQSWDDTEGLGPELDPIISNLSDPATFVAPRVAQDAEVAGMAVSDARANPQLAKQLAREMAVRRSIKDIDQYPELKMLLSREDSGWVEHADIDPFKRYEEGMRAFRDQRPTLGWMTSTAAYVRNNRNDLLVQASAIPALVGKAFTGSTPEWWSNLYDYTEREKDLINEFNIGAFQAVAGQTFAAVSDPMLAVSGGVGRIAAKAGAGIFANRANKISAALRASKGGVEATQQSVRNAVSGAAMVTAAQAYVGGAAERAGENLENGVSAYLSPTDHMWLAINAAGAGLSEKFMAGASGELGFLKPKSYGGIVKEDILLNSAQESVQSGWESLTLDFGMREQEFTAENISSAVAAAAIEGAAGGIIGAMNLPFAIRDKLVQGELGKAIDAANDVSRLQGLAQAAIGIGPMAKRVELHTRQYINSQLNTTASDRVYFTTADWDTYWQGKNLDSVEMLNKYKGVADEDGVISVPVADFIINANRDNKTFADLMDIVRPTQGGYNLVDAAKLVDDLPAAVNEIVKREIEKAGKISGDVVDDSNNIIEDVRNKMQDAKIPVVAKRQSSQIATLTAAYYRTLADDMNRAYGMTVSPSELYNKYGVLSYATDDTPGRRGGYDRKQRSIEYTRRADGSTSVHELAHHFLDVRAKVLAENGVDNEVFSKEQAGFEKFIGDNAKQVIDSYIERLAPEVRNDVRKELTLLGGEKFIKKWAGKLHDIDNYHAYAAIHEYFARGFELYMAKGIAPSQEMRSVYRKFMGWIAKAYGTAKNLLADALGVTLTPEGVRYMDRMIASRRAIDNEIEYNRYGSIVELLRESNTIPLEHVDDLILKTDESRDLMREKMMITVTERLKAEREEERQALRDMANMEAYAQLSSNDTAEGKLYNLVSEVTKGARLDDSPSVVDGRKIDYRTLETLGGKKVAEKLKSWGMTSEDGQGVNAQEVASKLGYESVEGFAKDMLALQQFDKRIDMIVDERIRAQESDADYDEASLRVIARELINEGEFRQEVLDNELAIILEEYVKTYQEKDLREQASREVGWAVSRVKAKSDKIIKDLKKIRDTNEQEKQDLQAYRSFHKRVYKDTQYERRNREGIIKFDLETKAITNLDPQGSASEASKQGEISRKLYIDGDLVNAFFAKKSETDKRFESEHSNVILKEFQELHRNITAFKTNAGIRKELREGASILVLDGDKKYLFSSMESAEKYVNDTNGADLVKIVSVEQMASDIVDSYMDTIVKTTRKDGKTKSVRSSISIVEARDIMKTLIELRNMVNTNNKMIGENRSHDIKDVAIELTKEAVTNAPKNPPNKDNPLNKIIGFAFGSGLRLSSYIDTLDGGKIGSWTKNILYRIQKGVGNANALNESYHAEFNKIAADTNLYDYKAGVVDVNAIRKPVGTTDFKANTHERRALLCYLGSVTGTQRVQQHLLASGISDPAIVINELKRTASKDDIAYVKAIFDQNLAIKKSIDDVMRSIGDAPASDVVLTPIILGEGDTQVNLDGGYYTVKYEQGGAQSNQDIWDLIRNGYSAHNMKPGASQVEERAAEVNGRKLNLSPEVHLNHLNEASKIVHLMTVAKDMNSLFSVTDKDSGSSILRDVSMKYGQSFADDLHSSIRYAITGPTPAANTAERFASKLRANASAAALAFNITSILKQPLGITNALSHKDISATHLASNIANVAKNFKASWALVRSKSVMMRDRTDLVNDSVREIHDAAAGNPPLVRVIQKVGMKPYAITQGMIDVPTWITAYETYLDRFKNEELAIQSADQLVRDTMGSGETTEMTMLHRNQWSRTLTMFGNFNITQLNIMYKAWKSVTRDPSSESFLHFLGAMWWAVIMAAFSNYVTDYALKGNKEGFTRGVDATTFTGRQAMKAAMDMSPIGRMFSEVAIGDSDSMNAPFFRPMLNAAKVSGEVSSVVFGDKSVSEIDPVRFSNLILGSVGVYIGAPAGLVNRTVGGIAEGDARMTVFGAPQQAHR